MVFVIKFQLNSDIRRVTCNKFLNWNETVAQVATLFELNGKFVLKFKDEEGDMISVSSDREMNDAFAVMSNQKQAIRFTVVPAALEEKMPQNNNGPMKVLSSNPNELVLDIDVGNMLPEIQNLIKTYAPQLMPGVQAAMQAVPRPVRPDHGTVVHHGVTCDGCHASPIQGIRWKCSVCADYDLCETCMKAGTHKEHSFLQIHRQRSYWNACRRDSNSEEPKPEAPKEEEPVKVEEPKVEEPKRVEEPPKKVEEPVKVEEPPKKPEAPKEEPVKVEEPPKKVEAPKVTTELENKLKQLNDMGFPDGDRNLALLIHHHGDVVKVVMDLLAL